LRARYRSSLSTLLNAAIGRRDKIRKEKRTRRKKERMMERQIAVVFRLDGALPD